MAENQKLRDEYVRTLTAKLAATENTAMAVVLMERIEHYLGTPESAPDQQVRSAPPAHLEPSTNEHVHASKNGARRGRKAVLKWQRIQEVLREHDGLTLADLATTLIKVEPAYWDDSPTHITAKSRLSAMLGGTFKKHFIRPAVLGGKWSAAV